MKGPKTIVGEKEITTLPLDKCLAKTLQNYEGNIIAGCDVFTHCLIVGEVARALIARQPLWLQTEFFSLGSELIASAHDVGKVCPTFQVKIHNAITNKTENDLIGFENIDPSLESEWQGHAGVSQITVQGVGKYIPEILGRHHGSSPSVALHTANDEVFGGITWQKKREELLLMLKEYFQCNWPLIKNDVQAAVVSGLTTVADWIGSGSSIDINNSSLKSTIPAILDSAGFRLPPIIKDLSFNDIFQFVPRPAQLALISSATQAGVYVMEAPMGLGKTEAALYAAYQILAKGAATGICFALPSQLTSNRIYERMNRFLNKIIPSDYPQRNSILVHSGASLLEDFDLGEEGRPGQSWFDSSKRGLLAPFAVGTIDQALMAVLNVKHGFVRTFGLAGKVVILDEVHAYDSYTGTILDSLVKTLKALQCTVIILSATLTKEKRESLIGLETKNNNEIEAYPLVTGIYKNGELTQYAIPVEKNHDVKINILDDMRLAYFEALKRASDGAQILWVENTVDEAQEIFKLLAARANECNVDCGLLHSRFLKTDRNIIEEKWVSTFGPEGVKERIKKGRILIGTQVVEQSLDIDADFLITRLCPTDMLFQRIGRMWRHETNDLMRPKGIQREAWILNTNLTKTELVYSPYVLKRTLNVWQKLNIITIPSQIRSLIESTYCAQTDTPDLALLKHVLDEKRCKLKGLALVGLSHSGKTLPENVATRYSEIDTVNVLLIIKVRNENTGHRITFLDGRELFLPNQPWTKNGLEWRRAAIELQKNTVTVSEYLAPKILPVQTFKWLEKYVYISLDQLFRIALVCSSGEIVSLDGTQASDKYVLSYNNEIGYQAKKQ